MRNLKRYSNNALPGGISSQVQEKLLNSKVLVVGAGALGSGVLMNLAALGIGQIKIVDNEIIKEQDLSNQIIHKYKNIGRSRVLSSKDWIQEFNPDIKVELDKIKLNELNYFNIIQGYDIIVDCLDHYELKYLLNEIAFRHKKILVYGNVKPAYGQVTTFAPGKTGCLACVFEKPFMFKKENYAIFPQIVNTVASLEVNEVFKIITGYGEPLLGKILLYNAQTNEFKNLEYCKNPHCSVCADK